MTRRGSDDQETEHVGVADRRDSNLISDSCCRKRIYAQRGHWYDGVVVRDTEGKAKLLTLSLAGYPATCGKSLSEVADKVESTNGYVWIDDNEHVRLSYEQKPGFSRYEVIEFRCAYSKGPPKRNM